MSELKNDPAYSEGYFDALNGVEIGPNASSAFRAGWEAATASKAILIDAGFKETAPGQFSKTTTIERPTPTQEHKDA